eukprot:15468701-Alexandrium_andersonii.AAC.1
MAHRFCLVLKFRTLRYTRFKLRAAALLPRPEQSGRAPCGRSSARCSASARPGSITTPIQPI